VRSLGVLTIGFLLACGSANGQGISNLLKRETAQLKPVSLEAGVSELGVFSSISNAVFKPAGSGPFPAVVLAHTCGGVGRPHIRERMRELLDAGFVVLPLDSFGPRGIASTCGNAPRRLGTGAMVMDAYAALEHLSRLQIVDPARIYATGYSYGAVVTPMLASPQSAAVFESNLRFRALVSNYGACTFQRSPEAPRIHFLQKDVDRPLLMLMAGEDKEYKPADCFPLLDELKAAGKAVEWHVYPDTHHAWDQRDQTGMMKVTTGWGEVGVYLYSAEATRDSTRRMIEFFNAQR
jgi:dienelactone hydrolase